MATDEPRRTFISYSCANADFALKLAKELKSAGFSIWLDQLDIPTGARWDDEVEKALHECEIFLVIITPASSTSENVKDEIDYAIDHNKHILPVLLQAAEIPFRLRRFEYVDFTNKTREAGIASVKSFLQSLANDSHVPLAAPANTAPSAATKSL
jgi:TIR domain